jgi:hypothetical protein
MVLRKIKRVAWEISDSYTDPDSDAMKYNLQRVFIVIDYENSFRQILLHHIPSEV